MHCLCLCTGGTLLRVSLGWAPLLNVNLCLSCLILALFLSTFVVLYCIILEMSYCLISEYRKLNTWYMINTRWYLLWVEITSAKTKLKSVFLLLGLCCYVFVTLEYIFEMSIARYGLFVQKVELNANQPIYQLLNCCPPLFIPPARRLCFRQHLFICSLAELCKTARPILTKFIGKVSWATGETIRFWW